MPSIDPSSHSEARRRFCTLVEGPESAINLAEAALVIAKEEHEGLDVDAYLGVLDGLARTAAAHLSGLREPADQVDALSHFLFVEQGFRGNRDNYYDPANSFLNEVLDQRVGIPITLALVYTEVGQRLGIPVFGVGFPGHFLVKHVGGDPEILLDPFFGARLTAEQCLERLRTMYGPSARLEPALLRPAAPREILVRILRNLKNVYLQREDWMRTLSCLDRILLIAPDDPGELRDRGLTYHRLECFAPALADLERYLAEARDEDDGVAAIRALLPTLHRAVKQLN
jgi:regulator of sirC expression with transglutaminase-like and TPR domain